jgi:hypothetical protein
LELEVNELRISMIELMTPEKHALTIRLSNDAWSKQFSGPLKFHPAEHQQDLIVTGTRSATKIEIATEIGTASNQHGASNGDLTISVEK